LKLDKSQWKVLGVVMLCGVAAALASYYLAPKSFEGSRADQISEAAYAAHPDDPIAGAKASTEALRREFKNTVEEGSARKMAASVFLGYYVKNVYAIPAVCAERGVQLTSYPEHFSRFNSAPLEMARRFLDVEALAADLRGDLSAARKELDRVTAMQKSDLRQVCVLLQESGEDIASGSTFATLAPEIYATLMNDS